MSIQQIAGVILAGGAGTRISGEKALLPFGAGMLLDAVIERVAPQVSRLALNVPKARAGKYAARYPDYPMLFDPFPDRVGPLAGVIAGLQWARGFGDVERLATFPCDAPFLPYDLVKQLIAQARDKPVFAYDRDRFQGTCAIWPLQCFEDLHTGVEAGRLRSLQSAMDALGGQTCNVAAGEHAFFNINTRDDLACAEGLARDHP